MMRRRLEQEMERVAAGEDPKGIIRDPRSNVRLALPVAGREGIEKGYTREQIRANPRLRRTATSFIFQAGQPASVRKAFSEAMGLEATEFAGLDQARN